VSAGYSGLSPFSVHVVWAIVRLQCETLIADYILDILLSLSFWSTISDLGRKQICSQLSDLIPSIVITVHESQLHSNHLRG
jgi:hypothetical protein